MPEITSQEQLYGEAAFNLRRYQDLKAEGRQDEMTEDELALAIIGVWIQQGYHVPAELPYRMATH